MQGNNLAISSIYEDQIILQDFALGSDYQIDEFQIGNSYSGYESYTAEQFLAEMGLSL